MRLRSLSVLSLVLIALASPAVAQAPDPPLETMTGSPIAFRVDLPRGWELERNGGYISAGRGRVVIAVGATDMYVRESVPAGMSEAEARRRITTMTMSSDSSMFEVMNMLGGLMADNDKTQDKKYEIRTLGGQRAGYVTGWMEMRTSPRARMDRYLTVKDGIAYLAVFMVEDARHEAHQPLFARVLDSFAFPAAP